MPSAQGVTAEEGSDPPEQEAFAQASLTTLVAHFVLHEIDPATLEMLCREDVVSVFDKLEPGCAEYLAGRTWVPSDYEEAAADYCTAFILDKQTAPYATAWLTGDPLMKGPQIAAQVTEVATALGLDATTFSPEQSRPGRLPPDHLGVLLSLVAEAWQQDPAAAGQLVDELLAPWVPALGKALHSRSSNPFYRALGSLMGQLAGWR